MTKSADAATRALLARLTPEPERAEPQASVLEGLHRIDARLVKAGVHPISHWWWGEIDRFYAGRAQLLVEMVGRGGDKSRTSVKMALAETLYGDFTIPRGEVHFFTHISESVTEAEKTMGILARYLETLGEPFETRGRGTIELGRLPRGFKVLACRVGAVSGWRCFGWTADECAKWHNEGTDPAAEIITSIRGMTITHARKARGRMLSSPLGRMGFFYEEWIGGDTTERQVGHAPSWVANPSVTEDDTRRLEPNESKRKREYAAIPMEGTEESFFSPGLLDLATRATGDLPREKGVAYVAAMDPAFTRNAWTLIIAGRRLIDGRIKRSVVFAKQWQATGGAALNPEDTLREIAEICARYGIEVVESDQYEKFSLANIAGRVGLAVRVAAGSSGEQLAAYESIATMFADGQIDLPTNPQLRSDLVSVRQKLTPNGFTVHLPITPDGRHCDYAPSFRLAMMRCMVDPIIEAPQLTAEQRIANLRAAEAKRWAEIEKAGDASAVAATREGKSWVDRMEEEWNGGR